MKFGGGGLQGGDTIQPITTGTENVIREGACNSPGLGKTFMEQKMVPVLPDKV